MDTGAVIVCGCIWMAINVLAGAALGHERGRPAAGIALALVAGPLGWIATLLLTPTARREVERQMEIEEERARRAGPQTPALVSHVEDGRALITKTEPVPRSPQPSAARFNPQGATVRGEADEAEQRFVAWRSGKD